MSKKTIACILAMAGLLFVGNDGLGRGFGGGGGGSGSGGGGGFRSGSGGGYNGGTGSVRYSGGTSSGYSGGVSNTYRPSNYGSIQNSSGYRGSTAGWQTNSAYRSGASQLPAGGAAGRPGGAWVAPGGNAAVVQGPRGGVAAGAKGPAGGSVGAIQTAYGVRGGVARGPAGGAVGGVRGPAGGAVGGVKGPGGGAVVGARGPYGGRGVAALPSGYAAASWRGSTYYHSGHNFYRPYWYNNAVYYWPVSVPIGWFYPTLPSDAIQYSTDSASYYYYNGSYYQPSQQDGQSGYAAVQGPNQDQPPQGDQPAPSQFANAPPDPFQILKKASEFMGSQTQLTMTVDDTFDEVNDAGQKIQLSSQRTIRLQRPNRIAIDFFSDDKQRHILYDGNQFTAIDLEKNLYCVIAQQGSVDGMLDKLAKDYNMALPLDDLLYTNSYDRLASKIEAGQYAGQDTVNGVMCDHLAFRQQGVDWEAWIQQGQTPMVRKLSINYSDTAGQPRYVLEITKWDTDPIPASSFQLELPKDARQIDLLATIKAGSENVGAPPAASPDAK